MLKLRPGRVVRQILWLLKARRVPSAENPSRTGSLPARTTTQKNWSGDNFTASFVLTETTAEDPALSRRKSCLACIRAKSRCDSGKPECEPCRRKGRKCTYSSDSPYLGERQSVPSSTRSGSEQLSQNVQRAKPITSREVSQSTSLNPSIFDTSETSQLSVSPGSSTSLSSEPSECKSGENVAATRGAYGELDMPAIWGQLQTPCPFPSRLLQPKERQSAETVLINKLISQVICSFPERMNRASSPPFIHQSTFLQSMNTIPTNDPIVICQDIIRKFTAHETHGDFPIWDAIASE